MKKYQLACLISILCLSFAAQSSIELYNKDGHKVSLKGRVLLRFFEYSDPRQNIRQYSPL